VSRGRRILSVCNLQQQSLSTAQADDILLHHARSQPHRFVHVWLTRFKLLLPLQLLEW
jgi:hypothetical protein